MACPLCNGNVSQGSTILPFEIGKGRVIVVLNVPASICDQCGEDYIDMEVARNLESLLDRVERDGLSMGFVEYGTAA